MLRTVLVILTVLSLALPGGVVAATGHNNAAVGHAKTSAGHVGHSDAAADQCGDRACEQKHADMCDGMVVGHCTGLGTPEDAISAITTLNWSTGDHSPSPETLRSDVSMDFDPPPPRT